MVMMGLQLTDKLPFHTVYLHAMVRDKEGRKMSKSLGNVIDPLEVIKGCTLASLFSKLENGNLPKKEIEKAKKDQQKDFPDGIPECGSDALRFGLLAYTVQGKDVNLDIKRVVAYRQFCNKLWNATRFAIQFLSDFNPVGNMEKTIKSSGKLALRDKWMISRLETAVKEVNYYLENYEFGISQQKIHSFWLEELSRVYMELIKPVVYDESEENKDRRWAAQATLWYSMDVGLRLLHPMMPFVTEELWQRMPGRGSLGKEEAETIMLARYPEADPSWIDPKVESDMSNVLATVSAMLKLRDAYNIAIKDKPTFFAKSANEETLKFFASYKDDLGTLGKGVVKVNEDAPKTSAVNVVDENITVYMDLAGMVDFGKELKKLEKAKEKVQREIDMLEKKMAAPQYSKVNESVRAANDEKLTKSKAKLNDIVKAMKNFEELLKGL